jgi:ADP-ribose pyrophosphatase
MFGKPRFSASDMEVMEEKVFYKGFFKMLGYKVRHRLFHGGWGKPISRELFWRPRAVGVLMYDPARDLVALVEQFRIGALEHPAGPWLLEIVAGLVEEGESLEDVAHRELAEEGGLTAQRLIPIHNVLLTPGGSNERIALYCGIGELSGDGGIFGLPEEGEDIRLHIVSREQALAALAAGQCDNAPLTICLQWLALHYLDIVNGSL